MKKSYKQTSIHEYGTLAEAIRFGRQRIQVDAAGDYGRKMWVP